MDRFEELQSRIAEIGRSHHAETILENSRANARHIRRTIRDVMPCVRPCLVVSAGPSLYREKILNRVFAHLAEGASPLQLVVTDGAYIQCLKAGIVPDWVITIDPHPTRICRWFGDPNFRENQDGYWERQDLDLDFRTNSVEQNEKNFEKVDRHKGNLAIATSAPANVVERTAAFDRYWFSAIVDSPVAGSLTRTICEATGCPALNTGGTVGTAAILFAQAILGSKNVAIVGCDMGYYSDTPYEQTQEFNMLKGEPDIAEFYPQFVGVNGIACYTSPTYFFYRQNLLDLLASNNDTLTNCSGHGMLFGPNVECVGLEKWLMNVSGEK